MWEKGWAGGVRGDTETFGASGLWQREDLVRAWVVAVVTTWGTAMLQK